jgi:glycosyltransferase involved in cell wall biosynthesis
MNTPTVSLVTATFNRAELLPRVWESLRNESLPFEWVVVDDASTDSTEAVVRAFRDPRIVFLSLKHNQGTNAARNAGVRAACGQFVIFLDSDDELAPNALASAAMILEAAPPNVGALLMIAQPARATAHSTTLSEGAVLNEKDIVVHNRLRRDRAVIYRNAVFANQMLPEEFRGVEFVFVFGISRWWNYLVVNAPLTLVHRQSDNLSRPQTITSNSRGIAEGWEQVIRNHAAILRRHPLARADLYGRVLYRYAVAADWSAMWRAFHAFRADQPGPCATVKGLSMIVVGTIGHWGGDRMRLKWIRLREEGALLFRQQTP